MTTTTQRLTVAKITETELDELTTFLQEIGEQVEQYEHTDIDNNEANVKIGKLVRDKFPSRPAFLAPVNLHILLDNYQDKDGDILEHPKWLMEIYELLEEIDNHLSTNSIEIDSTIRNKIKKYVSPDEDSI